MKSQNNVTNYKPSALCGFRADILDHQNDSIIRVNLGYKTRSRMVNALMRTLRASKDPFHTDRYGNHVLSKTAVYLTDASWGERIRERIWTDLGLVRAEYPARWCVIIRELRLSSECIPEEPVVVRVLFDEVNDAYSYIKLIFPQLEKIYSEMVSDQNQIIIGKDAKKLESKLFTPDGIPGGNIIKGMKKFMDNKFGKGGFR